MHPFGFLANILLVQPRRATNAPRIVPDEPLPPIDEATIRAWRAWARAEHVVDPTPTSIGRPASVQRHA